MTEHGNKSNEELASAFITNTCEVSLKKYLVNSDQMHNLMASTRSESIEYPILCGSLAEFYIRPLITCIDDSDILIARINELAFSGDFPVMPSDLSGFADTIKCYKIEPYESYPGFVRVRVLGEMNYNWRYNTYEFNPTANTNSCLAANLNSIVDHYTTGTMERNALPNTVSGPAIKTPGDFLGFDFVYSIWCPQWPKEARDWLNRSSINVWPTTEIKADVVQNGCHLVYIQHRSCRNDRVQWRFSFSMAEVILIQSWTKTQQIVYHLLRFFAKRELIRKDCPKEDEVLCTYHLKTLMLWTCEEMSLEWWKSSSVIAICCQLLKKLAEWLKKRCCPNYFIPEANLLQCQSSSIILQSTLRQLAKFCNSATLCHWFVEHYIISFILRAYEPIDRMPHFSHYMMPLIEFWKVRQFPSLEFYFCKTFIFTQQFCRAVINYGLHSGLRHGLKSTDLFRSLELKAQIIRAYLPTIQNVLCFTYHDTLLYILQSAYGVSCGEISWDSSLFVEFVNAISIQPKIVRSQYHNFPKMYTEKSSRFQFLRAQSLMVNLTGANSHSEFKLLALMSKVFLSKSLNGDGTTCTCTSNRIVPAAMAYLAAINFVTSEYQIATRLCSVILVDQTSLEDKETLNAGCLLFIDDVARIVGLCVLQRKITENNLHHINSRLYLDLRLSPDVFAQYLSVLSAEKTYKRSDFCNDLPGLFFPTDLYLNALIKPQYTYFMKSSSRYNAARQLVYWKPDSLTKSEASNMNPTIVKARMLDTLMEYAVENMALFYNVIGKDFGVNCNTIDCYRALYLYKARQFDQVLHVCERILKNSDLQDELKHFTLANVLLLPPLDSLFDEDVQSLLGFHTLFYSLSPLNDVLGGTEYSHKSTFEHCFARRVYHDKEPLHSLLLNHYSIKYHYFLGKHFLAKYLKLKCCIDGNSPYSDALTEFAAHRSSFSFELIIRRFLLRRTCI